MVAIASNGRYMVAIEWLQMILKVHASFEKMAMSTILALPSFRIVLSFS